jgi:penicillin-binding protein 1C
VSLLELVRGFAVLANEGRTLPLHAVIKNHPYRDKNKGRRIFSAEAATMVSDVLSDPWARSLEFGRYSLLDFPVQTAVKTGTSTDYRDAWSVGYDSRYVVGIWMGNLDQTPMDGITGSTGPGLVLRGLFAYLNRDQNTSKLALSSELFLRENCSFRANPCRDVFDYRTEASFQSSVGDKPAPFIKSPTQDLRLAFDPRLPEDRQAFRFSMGGISPDDEVTWKVNGETVATAKGGDFDWPVSRGYYSVTAKVKTADGEKEILGPIAFSVR